ncbi:MAG TPA: class I SAM-dependent methyltransferase [Verrucomicrobiae bacterium]|nr:class I SAM-dependent methyltransferase [Verrucomicrobiae bacterium]
MNPAEVRPQRRLFQQRIVDFARQYQWFGRPFNDITFRRSQAVVSFFAQYLPASGRVLDIGTGTGHVAAILPKPGRSVVGCDIMNLLMIPLPYVLADGSALPFLSASFDAAMLITVLHHVPKPLHARFFNEAARVLKPGGTLILMEDTFHGGLERYATMFFDSVMNAEFAGHPHANRTLADWTALMTQAGLRLQQSLEQVAWYGSFRIRHGIVVGLRP